MAQFPLSNLFDGTKTLFMKLMALKDDGTYEVVAIDNNSGVKTALVTELPSGTNNIGHMNIDTLPEVAIINNAEGNPILTSNSGSATSSVILQPASSAVGVGNAFTVGSFKTLTIEIYGTSTSQTVQFQGMGPSGTPYPIVGTKLNDGTTGSQSTALSQIWRFDITGLTSFQANLTAVSGGTVTVSGTAVV